VVTLGRGVQARPTGRCRPAVDPSTASASSQPSGPSSKAGTTAATGSPGPRPPTRSSPTPPVNEIQTHDSMKTILNTRT